MPAETPAPPATTPAPIVPTTPPQAVEPATTTPSPPPRVEAPAPPATPPTRRRRPPLGYRAYQASFTEIGFAREVAPWVSPDGTTAVTLGGLRFYEHRGMMINTVIALLTIVNAANTPMTPVTTDHMGRKWVNADAEDRAHEEFNQKVLAGAAQKPWSLEMRGYHDSMGSDMNGMSFALDRTSVRPGGDGMWAWGLVGGWLETNRNYVPAMTTSPMEFTRWWIGATFDWRRQLIARGPAILGVHVNALLAYADPWLALLSVGPELAITDRLHLSAHATSDLHRFDASSGIGWRGELGVRF